jgi:hypothetical protein
MQTIVTKAELARKLQLSRARISQLCNLGLPTLPDGRIELQAALDWIDSHVDRSRNVGRRDTPVPALPPQPTVAMDRDPDIRDPARVLLLARARKAEAEACRIQRLEQEAAGELVPRAKVAEFITTVAYVVRDTVLAQADRLANRLAGTTDEAEAYKILHDDAHLLLRRLSAAMKHDSVGPAGAARQ